MSKRIYFESIKLWMLKNWKSEGGGLVILGIFAYLASTGAIEITGYSMDSLCAGTIEDPCIALINFTVPKSSVKNNDIFIYPQNYDPFGRTSIEFSFDPSVKSWKLQRSWGKGWRNIPLNKSCTGTWCGLSNKDDKRIFAYAFREGRSYQIRILAYKNDAGDNIKWGAFNGKVDPTWIGYEAFYKNYTNQEPVYREDIIIVKPVFIEKNKTTFPGYNWTNRTKIGYENIVYQKPAERTDYVGMKIGNTYFKNVVREQDGSFWIYKERNPKIFCKDCRCRQYEQDSGICWELKLNLTAISKEIN